jgi:hypothetical protein
MFPNGNTIESATFPFGNITQANCEGVGHRGEW